MQCTDPVERVELKKKWSLTWSATQDSASIIILWNCLHTSFCKKKSSTRNLGQQKASSSVSSISRQRILMPKQNLNFLYMTEKNTSNRRCALRGICHVSLELWNAQGHWRQCNFRVHYSWNARVFYVGLIRAVSGLPLWFAATPASLCPSVCICYSFITNHRQILES